MKHKRVQMRNLKKKEKKEARTLQFKVETDVLYCIPARIPSLQTVFHTVFSVLCLILDIIHI